jgi:hypothetical protein
MSKRAGMVAELLLRHSIPPVQTGRSWLNLSEAARRPPHCGSPAIEACRAELCANEAERQTLLYSGLRFSGH